MSAITGTFGDVLHYQNVRRRSPLLNIFYYDEKR